MTIVLKILFAISSIVLIVSILMQSGKSAGLSGSIGGGAEQIFGKSEAKGWEKTFDKMTKISAVVFLACAVLYYLF